MEFIVGACLGLSLSLAAILHYVVTRHVVRKPIRRKPDEKPIRVWGVEIDGGDRR